MSEVRSFSFYEYNKYSEAIFKSKMNKYKFDAVMMRNTFYLKSEDFDDYLESFEVNKREEKFVTEKEMKTLGFGKKRG